MPHGVVEAVRDVDFSIHENEWVAIMGPSGSGKSTLLTLLGCLDRCTSGRTFFCGQETGLLSDAALSLIRAEAVGFIFQSFHLIEHMTLFENMQVPFLYQSESISNGEATDKITEAIDQVGLLHRLHHLPKQLSGGEMQRAAIARALAIEPRLILADEPTGNLDSECSKQILNLFSSLHSKGATLVVVTHSEEVAKHCQRIVTMKDGRLNDSL